MAGYTPPEAGHRKLGRGREALLGPKRPAVQGSHLGGKLKHLNEIRSVGSASEPGCRKSRSESVAGAGRVDDFSLHGVDMERVPRRTRRSRLLRPL